MDLSVFYLRNPVWVKYASWGFCSFPSIHLFVDVVPKCDRVSVNENLTIYSFKDIT